MSGSGGEIESVQQQIERLLTAVGSLNPKPLNSKPLNP